MQHIWNTKSKSDRFGF